MMTRGNLARQTEEQLRLALQELKEYKKQNELLLSEREDNEKEILNIIQKNSELKTELNRLNVNYDNVCQKNLELQEIVDSFDQCRDEYEEALNNTSVWKRKLDEAHSKIKTLENQIVEHNSSNTQNLFQEMFGRDPSILGKDVTKNNQTLPIIDLTGDDTMPSHTFQSKSKSKKYNKINKCIKKTRQLLLKNKKNMLKLSKLKNSSIHIKNKYIACTQELENTKCTYEAEVCGLQTEITYLHNTLQCITKKYELAQTEIASHISALNTLLEVSHYNEDRVNSLLRVNSLCQCKVDYSADIVCGKSVETVTKTSSVKNSPAPSVSEPAGIVIYSDEIGRGVGGQLSKLYEKQSVYNTCMPGATFSQIINKILNTTHCSNTTLIILVGRLGSVNNKHMDHYIELLRKLKNISKIILFTFPYFKRLPQENEIRYKRNCQL